MHDDQEHDLQSPNDMDCERRPVNRQAREARHEIDSELKTALPDALHAAAEAAAGRAAIEAVEAMGEGVALLNMDGSIRNANGAFAALVGLDKDALKGWNVRELLPDIVEEDVRTVRATITRVAGKLWKRDPHDALSIVTPDGTRKWTIPSVSNLHGTDGSSLGMVLTLRDVTPLINTQRRLRESERKYRELVENANSIIIRITPDHRIVYFNEFAQNFFGYSADEVLGHYVIGTIAPAVDAEGRDMHERLEALSRDPASNQSDEIENMRKDGRRVWIHWSHRAVLDAAGQVREILCVGHDITQRKHLEHEASLYRQRLRRLTDRLVRKEESERRRVASQIHDTVIQSLSLGTIHLGGIRKACAAAAMHDRLELLDRVRQLMTNAINECRGLMGELTPPLLYEIGLGSALDEFAAQQSTLHQRVIAVKADDRFVVENPVWRSLLFQATRELIMNALKYAGPCEIHVQLTLVDKCGHITVRDTGKGFDPTRPDLAHNHGDGGFGLFNIRERLAGIDGRLQIDSQPGRGTTATLIVPPSTLVSCA